MDYPRPKHNAASSSASYSKALRTINATAAETEQQRALRFGLAWLQSHRVDESILELSFEYVGKFFTLKIQSGAAPNSTFGCRRASKRGIGAAAKSKSKSSAPVTKTRAARSHKRG